MKHEDNAKSLSEESKWKDPVRRITNESTEREGAGMRGMFIGQPGVKKVLS